MTSHNSTIWDSTSESLRDAPREGQGWSYACSNTEVSGCSFSRIQDLSRGIREERGSCVREQTSTHPFERYLEKTTLYINYKLHRHSWPVTQNLFFLLGIDFTCKFSTWGIIKRSHSHLKGLPPGWSLPSFRVSLSLSDVLSPLLLAQRRWYC